MEKKFVTEALHSGYLVELRNGERRILAKVGNGTRILLNPKTGAWNYLSHWDGMGRVLYNMNLAVCEAYLPFKAGDIVKVWGRITGTMNYGTAASTSDEGRTMLWERQGAVKLTVAEISKRLGYEVEVVEEGSGKDETQDV
jgi:hypothetical protein